MEKTVKKKGSRFTKKEMQELKDEGWTITEEHVFHDPVTFELVEVLYLKK